MVILIDMGSQRVCAIINNKEVIISIDVPEHFSEIPTEHTNRAKRLISERMQAMGVTKWKVGFASEAAEKDGHALTILLHSRRSDGQDVSLTSLLSPKKLLKNRVK